ncbi:MAG: Crp/Fnr family transcriptional regulator [Opitutales bacterium]|jgi:CRP/FNR family transcriptional regulator, dissimilatory nitrate respiration regulator|nr:Crp/Fnr family transcriptional regulator [Opitutales bacterium]MBT5169079.1 Crp/Fnr family transcriptional regulator [Opitutales bacterium]
MRALNSRNVQGRLLHSALEQSKVFGALRSELLKDLVEICDVVSLNKGEYLFREGDVSSGFYIVHHGAIRLHKVSPEGSKQILKIFRRRESFGESTVVSLSCYPADACADCPTILARVDKMGIQKLGRKSEAIRQCLSSSLVRHLDHLVSKLEARAFFSPESRLAQWILDEGIGEVVNGPSSFEIGCPKRSVADELEIASETFSRKLRNLRERGYIRVSGSRIEILDSEGLRVIATKEH